MGISDLSVAKMVYERARAKGIGMEIPNPNAAFPPAGAPAVKPQPFSSSTTVFRRIPIELISISNMSPAFIQSGGLRVKPTPAGVPVAITSPGFNTDHELKYEIKNGMSKIKSPVDALCNDLAVQLAGERERCRIGNLVGRDEPRSERAAVMEVLAGVIWRSWRP